MQNKLCFTIPGTIRIKKNSRRIYGFGKFKKNLPSKAYETWELQARALFVMKHFGFPTFTRPCHVKAMFYYRGPEFDLHGAMESIADAMEGLVWNDDKQIVSWDWSRKERDKANPRTYVEVTWEDGVEDKPMSQDECHRIASLIGRNVTHKAWQNKEVKA